jgi:hypothetical protein
MNAVVTSHLPVCLYSAAGVKVIVKSHVPAQQSTAPTERWITVHEKMNRQIARTRSMVGPPRARIILIVSRQRAQGRCFSDLRHSEA